MHFACTSCCDYRSPVAFLLVCPACRTITEDRIDVQALEPSPDGALLVCGCGRRYPIIDGVPLVLASPASYLRGDPASIVERDLPAAVVAELVADGPDDAAYPRLVEHLSIYLDAHWGDRATPPPDGPAAQAAGASALIAKIAERARHRVELAVELGCSTGRIVAELAAGAERVIGVELQHAAVRRARRLLDGLAVEYPRRIVGRHYTAATARAGDLAVPADRRLLVCGDALDPPLVPGAFDRVVALNVVDSVPSPAQLLAVVDGLCKVGGELILSSPYAWQSGVMAEDERFGGADPARALVERLERGIGLSAAYAIEEEAELPWTLRKDARTCVSYSIHYVRARKM